MKAIIFSRSYLIAIFSILFFVGCKKHDLEIPQIPVTGDEKTSALGSLTRPLFISPNTGGGTTLVTLSNLDFGTNQDIIKVTINEQIARIVQFSSNRVVVQVPMRAGTGHVTVKTPTTEYVGPVFNYIWSTTVMTPEISVDPTLPFGSFSGGICIDTPRYANQRVYVASYSYIGEYMPEFINIRRLYGGREPGYLNRPVGIVCSEPSRLMIVDANNHRIVSVHRRTPDEGFVFAGTGVAGYSNGSGSNSQFNLPWGITRDALGNVYITEKGSSRVRKITPARVVSNVAGTGIAGFRDGSISTAQFNRPNGVAVDNSGNIYIADTYNHRIRKINPFGNVSTLAGSGSAGFADGQGSAAKFNYPAGLIIDKHGTLYVADEDNHRIRKITLGGDVSTLAGCGTAGKVDGDGTVARFSAPAGIAQDVKGDFYVVDKGNNIIRKIVVE